MASRFESPRIKKWPFFLGDFILVAAAAWIFFTKGAAASSGELAIAAACFIAGMIFGVWPFLTEFREETKRFDADKLRSTVEQIQQLEGVGKLVQQATEQWQDIENRCEATVKLAGETAKRTETETQRLQEITETANTRERDHLRLELDKRRRGEREWLEVLVGIMDHVFALHRAAVKSRQPALIRQIEGFRNACAEICRRVGLSQYILEPGERFDPKLHKTIEQRGTPKNAVVEETLAPGFSYQGQPIRLPMVALKSGVPETANNPTEATTIAAPNPEATATATPQSEFANPQSETGSAAANPQPEFENPEAAVETKFEAESKMEPESKIEPESETQFETESESETEPEIPIDDSNESQPPTTEKNPPTE